MASVDPDSIRVKETVLHAFADCLLTNVGRTPAKITNYRALLVREEFGDARLERHPDIEEPADMTPFVLWPGQNHREKLRTYELGDSDWREQYRNRALHLVLYVKIVYTDIFGESRVTYAGINCDPEAPFHLWKGEHNQFT